MLHPVYGFVPSPIALLDEDFDGVNDALNFRVEHDYIDVLAAAPPPRQPCPMAQAREARRKVVAKIAELRELAASRAAVIARRAVARADVLAAKAQAARDALADFDK